MRIFTRWKEKFCIFIILFILSILGLHYWLTNFDNRFYYSANDSTRCLSDLKSLKNQLNASQGLFLRLRLKFRICNIKDWFDILFVNRDIKEKTFANIAVTEYKDKIDKLLTKTQKDYNDKRKSLEVTVENCLSLKQEAILCQRQFLELKEECFKVKKNYDILQEEVDKLKSTKL